MLQLQRVLLPVNAIWRVGQEQRCETVFCYPNAFCYPLTKCVTTQRILYPRQQNSLQLNILAKIDRNIYGINRMRHLFGLFRKLNDFVFCAGSAHACIYLDNYDK